MQKNIINKALVFFITLIFLITSITPVIYADITEKNNTIESLDETDFEYNITETVPEIPIKPNNFSADNNPDNTAIDTMFNFSLYNQNTNNQNNSNPRDDDDVELLSIHYDEDIFILDNGVAIFNISINIPDSIYAEKYKQALGVPKNVTMGQVMEIPVNPTNASDDKNMSAGRKSYYRSVSSEQWFLLGLLTEITYSEMIPLNENGECKVFLQGIAYPKINDINGDTWTLGFGPKETDNMSSVTQYVSSIVGYSKLMMETFQDEQVFKRTWTTKIHLPKDSILYNISELEEKKWTLDFCDNTYFFTDISIENESIVVIDESLVVSETDDVNPASIVNYKSFELEYTITNPQAYNGFERSSLILENNTFYGGVLWHSDLIDWNWHYESNCTLYEYNNSGAQVQIDQHLEVDLKFKLIVHLDLEQAYVKPIFNASGLYILTFYGEIVYTPDPYSFIDYSTWFHFWLGPVWVGIQINAGCQLNFIFETYATAEFKTGIYVNASLKAGATYSIWNGFHIIWQPYFNTDFIEPTFEGTIDVFIRPSISFPISAMVYGIIGPQVTPELYLEGTFHGEYIQGQVDYFWYIKLGFCIYIGLRIGIPYIWSASWDWEIADWTILDWSSHDPSKDTLPPTTTLMAFPKKNGFIGRSLYVWFSAIDNGDVPSGVDETKFKVAYHPLMTYNYPDIWNITIIEPSYPGIYYDLYDINYYSIDNFGQQESTNTYWVDADLQPPTSIISPPSGSHIVGYEDPVTIQVPGSDATGYQVWYRIKSDTEPWSDWFSGEDDSSDTFIITNQYVGTCEVEYYSCDGLSNKENSKYAVYTVTSGYGGPVHNLNTDLYYNTIQDAINDAIPGHTIMVESGTYYETLDINKAITLIGENPGNTIIDGSDDNVIHIDSNDVSISGFTIRNGYNGIYLNDVSGCSIFNNIISGHDYDGIIFSDSDYNSINGNVIKYCSNQAIQFFSSSNNDIIGNTCKYVQYCGIWMRSSYYNDVQSNDFIYNKFGVCLDDDGSYNTISGNDCSYNMYGIDLRTSSNNNMITGNTCNDNDNVGLYLESSSNYNSIQNNDFNNNKWGMTIGWDTPVHHNTISNNNFNYNTYHGIYLWESSYSNDITDNDFHYNQWGMTIASVHDNTISDNSFYDNSYTGLYIWENSYSNTVEDNYLLYNDEFGLVISTAHENTISYNNINHNGCSGIYIQYSSKLNNIQGNNIYNNDDYGILLQYSAHDNSILYNNIYNNGYFGIDIRFDSYSNTISYNNIEHNNQIGVLIASNSYSNNINNNYISNNYRGVTLTSTYSNSIVNNHIGYNLDYGIFNFPSSNNNVLYHNSIFKNTENVFEQSSGNQWDNGYPSGGNYWDDYTGIDADGDGIGDVPYNLPGGGNNMDDYPLINQFPLQPSIFSNWIYPDVILANDTISVSVDVSDFYSVDFVDLSYDYGNDGVEDGVISMSFTSLDTWNAVIPAPGSYYIGMDVLFRVRVTTTDGWYRWSTGKTVEVFNNPPYIPSNPDPSDGAVEVDVVVTLNWTSDDPDPYDSVTYDVYFGETNPPPKISSNISECFFYLGVIDDTTTFYWRIIAWDNHNKSSVGPVWSFTTLDRPLRVHNMQTGEDFYLIQDAIDDPDTQDGDTLNVDNGIYYENVVVSKMLNLIGKNKETVIIDGGNEDFEDVVYISSDFVNISGFTIRNSGHEYYDAGIDIISNNNHITNNIILGNLIGVYLDGVSQNYIYNNNIISDLNYDNELGIYIHNSCDENLIIDNFISNYTWGILFNMYNNDNIIQNNTIEYALRGIHQYDDNDCTLIKNNDVSNVTYGITINSDLNIISNNNLEECYEGLDIEGNNNEIYGNYISNSSSGIVFYNAFYNNVYGNTIINCGDKGINIINMGGTYVSEYNHIYHNNFINNNPNAEDTCNNNIWDNGYPSGGNYWDDYTGIDSDEDGIGDTPYIISSGNAQDQYPLMYQWIYNPIPPDKPTNPSPDNGSTDIDLNVMLSAFVTDQNNDILNVSFYDYSITEESSIIYYYDSYMISPYIDWENPENFVDDSEDTYAYTYGDEHGIGSILLNGNNCDGKDLGTISNIEIRIKWDREHENFGLRFNSILYNKILNSDTVNYNDGNYSDWISIFNDLEPNQEWTWEKIRNLKIRVTAFCIPQNTSLTVKGYKAELKITYQHPHLLGKDNNVANGTRAFFEWTNLLPDKTYYWFVTSTDTNNQTTYSDIWNFKTIDYVHIPNKPENPYPINNSIVYNSNQTLSVIVSDLDNETLNVSFYGNEAEGFVKTTTDYYFNDYDPDFAWSSNPDGMVDGYADPNDPDHLAYTYTNNDLQKLNGNTCNGVYLGNIFKVEIRAYTMIGIGEVVLKPIYSEGNGENYTINATGWGWSDWFDITNDTNAPSNWSWADIMNLDCDVIAIVPDIWPVYCAKVDIRVSYFNSSLIVFLGSDNNVPSEDQASIILSNLTSGSTYYWYAIVSDPLGLENISDIWHFTYAIPPLIITNETEGIEERNTTIAEYLKDDGGDDCTAWFSYKIDGNKLEETTEKRTMSTGDRYKANIGRKQITYYYDEFNETGEQWIYKPYNMVDGDQYNYSFEYRDNISQRLMSNTCIEGEFGPVKKVEIKADAYWDGYGNPELYIRPVFNGSLIGESYILNASVSNWNTYIDITNDNNAPLSWCWDDIINLDCEIVTNDQNESDSITYYCSKVEIRVSYGNPLVPGELYAYHAVANNTAGLTNGSEMFFLTKPYPPTNLKANTFGSQDINLTWVKGEGAKNTYIERNIIENWERGEGVEIYNDTGTSYIDNPTQNQTGYYYKAWSTAKEDLFLQWSDDHTSILFNDRQKPEIQTINTNPIIQEIDGFVNISCNVFDNVLVDSVTLTVNSVNGYSNNITMTNINDTDIFYCNNNYNIDGIYECTIKAVDVNGNINTSDVFLFSICENVHTENINTGTNEINSISETDTIITIETMDVNTVFIGKHNSNPYPDEMLPADVLSKFIEVEILDEDLIVWPVLVKVFYTIDDLTVSGLNEDQLLGLYFWDEENNYWDMFTNTGVNTTDQYGYKGYLWAEVNHLSLIAPFGDYHAPLINSVNVSPVVQYSGGYVFISCYVDDNIEVSDVCLNVTSDYFSINQTMNNIPGSNYYYNDSMYIYPGLYEFFIWANDTKNNINMSGSYTFEIINQPPYMPDNPNPADNETNVPVEFYLSWTGGDPDPGDIVTYDVYFGTSSPPPQVVSGQSGNSYYPGTMNFNTTYYWQIVSWDNNGANNSSQIWSFTTIEDTSNNPPFPPSNPNPFDGETDVNIDADISWNCSDPDGDLLTYDVYFEANDSSPDILVSDNQTEMIYDPGTLNYETTYFWQIIATDEYGASTDGPVWSFTTEPEPVPDLDCSGNLHWTEVQPGATVTGTITVENVGETDSLLDWEVESYPEWGTWTFNPENGTDLLAGDLLTIDVEVVAPNIEDETFTGEVVLVNSENSSDICTIDVSLATPLIQVQQYHQIPRLMQNIIQYNLITRKLLEL